MYIYIYPVAMANIFDPIEYIAMRIRNEPCLVPTKTLGSSFCVSSKTFSMGPIEFVRMVAKPPTSPTSQKNQQHGSTAHHNTYI